MRDAPFALAFTAGVFAVLNPCGFAMLPAYLTTFLVGDADQAGRETEVRLGLRRAVVVSVAVSLGFAGLFAVVGLLVQVVAAGVVMSVGPWISIAIGCALVSFGIASVLGWEPRMFLPRLDRGGRSSSPRSMALYGMSYATVSLGCTLPTFLVYVAGTMSARSVGDGLGVFIAYAAGFASLLTALTISLAFARRSMVTRLRRALPLIQRVSGLLLVVAGLYVSYYGWYELRRLGEPDPIIDWVTGASFSTQRFVTNVGLTQRAWLVAVVVGIIAIWSLRRSDERPQNGTDSDEPRSVAGERATPPADEGSCHATDGGTQGAGGGKTA